MESLGVCQMLCLVRLQVMVSNKINFLYHLHPCLYPLYDLDDFLLAIFFFWLHRQGEDSSQDEKGASSILATQLDEELGGGAVQVTDWFTTIYL